MFNCETILNRMNFMIETEAIRDPRFIDEPNKWAFFMSGDAIQMFLREIYADIYLCSTPKLGSYQGYKIHMVDTLKESEVYFGRRKRE